jgi:hypothetical protein
MAKSCEREITRSAPHVQDRATLETDCLERAEEGSRDRRHRLLRACASGVVSSPVVEAATRLIIGRLHEASVVLPAARGNRSRKVRSEVKLNEARRIRQSRRAAPPKLFSAALVPKEESMYGTVAKCSVKPENRSKLRELVEQQMARRKLPGYVTSYLLFENDGDAAWLMAIFENRETYDRNADDPSQDADYREYRALMETDPEWHDGEIEGFPG